MTESVVVRYNGVEKVIEVEAGPWRHINIPYFDRMRTPEEYAELCARYPGNNGQFSPMLFGMMELSDTGERDAEGRRIFA